MSRAVSAGGMNPRSPIPRPCYLEAVAVLLEHDNGQESGVVLTDSQAAHVAEDLLSLLYHLRLVLASAAGIGSLPMAEVVTVRIAIAPWPLDSITPLAV